MKKRRGSFIMSMCLVCTVFVMDAAAQSGTLQKKIVINWTEGLVRNVITVPLDLDAMPFPRARREAEMAVTQAAPELFLSSMQNVLYDSSHTVGEYIASLPGSGDRKILLNELSILSTKGRITTSVVSEDYRFLEITFEYTLYGSGGLYALFLRHTEMAPLEEQFGYYPGRKYSGIVIYAKEPLAAFGRNDKKLFAPSLFPKIQMLTSANFNIQDEYIKLLFAPYMGNPEAIAAWGCVGYSYSTDENVYLERVGKFPLRIIAYGIYGKNNTDLIIPEESARQILSQKENMDLLRQGRVMVVMSDPDFPQE
ncbi:MAG: hypothetical protein JW904_04970 [Spirochaetales bacterium]|nr:hypothetical protein [Spirochaetales bacterium]